MSTTSNAHLMHITRRGRPWCKDIYDLFATLLISLKLQTHRSFFKTYPHSFNFDEAAANLTSLKFSQSSRSTDPRDPTRIITTTTTTTFTMTRDMGKAIIQHFMDARLVENALDPGSNSFKERGLYVCTAKGLHIIERFITKNGIATHHLESLFADQPVTMRCFHLERRSSDDDIYINKALLHVIWTRMVGLKPNVTDESDEAIDAFLMKRWWNEEIVYDMLNPDDGLVIRKVAKEDRRGGEEYQFPAQRLLKWLLDYTTVTGPDCAAELAAQLVRYGLISLVHDRGKVRDKDWVVTVRAGGAGGGAGALLQEAEFRATERAIYRITTEGMVVARWIDPVNSTNHNGKLANLGSGPSRPNLHGARSSNTSLHRPKTAKSDESRDRDQSLGRSVALSRTDSDRTTRENSNLNQSQSQSPNPNSSSNLEVQYIKDSHTARLRQILNEPAVRSLFREYLRKNFCEENLSFWLEVQDLKRKFSTSSSAVGSNSPKGGGNVAGQLTMEKHQHELLNCAFVIFNTYLAPASPCELNIDHNLRAEMINYMTALANERDAILASKDTNPVGAAPSIQASQVQNTVRIYERIQGHIFRLMATDSVPKFCKTDQFLTVMANLIDFADTLMDLDDPLETEMNNLSIGATGAATGAASGGGGAATPTGAGGAAGHEGDMKKPVKDVGGGGGGGGVGLGLGTPGGGFGVNDGEPARAFVTISQAANEKAARMEKLLAERRLAGH